MHYSIINVLYYTTSSLTRVNFEEDANRIAHQRIKALMSLVEPREIEGFNALLYNRVVYNRGNVGRRKYINFPFSCRHTSFQGEAGVKYLHGILIAASLQVSRCVRVTSVLFTILLLYGCRAAASSSRILCRNYIYTYIVLAAVFGDYISIIPRSER